MVGLSALPVKTHPCLLAKSYLLSLFHQKEDRRYSMKKMESSSKNKKILMPITKKCLKKCSRTTKSFSPNLIQKRQSKKNYARKLKT